MSGPVWHARGWGQRFPRNEEARRRRGPVDAVASLHPAPFLDLGGVPVNVHSHHHVHSSTGPTGSVHRTRTYIKPIHSPEIEHNTVGYASMLTEELGNIDRTLDAILAKSQQALGAAQEPVEGGSTAQLRRAINSSVERQVDFFYKTALELQGKQHICKMLT